MAALNQVERLRNQLQAMAGRSGRTPAAGQQPRDSGQPSQVGQGPGDQRSGQGTQPGPGQQGAQAGQGAGGGRPGGLTRGQDIGGGGQDGPVRPGTGARHTASAGSPGESAGGVNGGDGATLQSGGARGPQPNPADAERDLRQSMRELQALRGMVKGDPETGKEIAELSRKIQGLDQARSSGNPAVVSQLQADVLRAVDRLELQLRRTSLADARTGRSYAIPVGYNDSVAEYYRRLSKGR